MMCIPIFTKIPRFFNYIIYQEVKKSRLKRKIKRHLPWQKGGISMIGNDSSFSLSFLFSIVSLIGVIVAMASTIKKDKDTETRKEMDIEKHFIKLDLKLDTFVKQTETILKQQEKSNSDIQRLERQQSEIKTKLAEHERRLNVLDGGE